MSNEPPLGITPRYIHTEFRLQDILNAMLRYISDGKPIPAEWVDELEDLNTYLITRKEQQ